MPPLLLISEKAATRPCRMDCPSAADGPSSAATWPNRLVSELTPTSSATAGDAQRLPASSARPTKIRNGDRNVIRTANPSPLPPLAALSSGDVGSKAALNFHALVAHDSPKFT